MGKSKETVRITLDLTPQFYERLVQLQDLVEAESKANVIREALRLYEYLASRAMRGASFRVVNQDGAEETVALFGTIPLD